MSEKKDLNKEELEKVSGGVNYGRQVDIQTNQQGTSNDEQPDKSISTFDTNTQIVS